MPPTLRPRPRSSGSSSSDDRLINFVNSIEQSLRALFHGRDNEFLVTNDFVDQLIQSNAEALREAVKDQSEEALFYLWNKNIENYRATMFDGAEGMRFRGNRDVKIVTRDQLEAIRNFCPKPPDLE